MEGDTTSGQPAGTDPRPPAHSAPNCDGRAPSGPDGVRRVRISHRRDGRAALMVDDGGEVRIRVGDPAIVERMADELIRHHGLTRVRRAEWGRSRG